MTKFVQPLLSWQKKNCMTVSICHKPSAFAFIVLVYVKPPLDNFQKKSHSEHAGRMRWFCLILTDEAARLLRDIASAAESGWDFSSRWMSTNSSSNDTLRNLDTCQIIPVDLNSILCHNEKTLALHFNEIGKYRSPLHILPVGDTCHTAYSAVQVHVIVHAHTWVCLSLSSKDRKFFNKITSPKELSLLTGSVVGDITKLHCRVSPMQSQWTRDRKFTWFSVLLCYSPFNWWSQRRVWRNFSSLQSWWGLVSWKLQGEVRMEKEEDRKFSCVLGETFGWCLLDLLQVIPKRHLSTKTWLISDRKLLMTFSGMVTPRCGWTGAWTKASQARDTMHRRSYLCGVGVQQPARTSSGKNVFSSHSRLVNKPLRDECSPVDGFSRL